VPAAFRWGMHAFYTHEAFCPRVAHPTDQYEYTLPPHGAIHHRQWKIQHVIAAKYYQ